MNVVQYKIVKNRKKIYKLERREEKIQKCIGGGMVAIFVTGIPAFASFVTPIPTGIAVSAYAISNVFTIGSLIYGVSIEAKKQELKKETESLKQQINYLAKETETTLYSKEKTEQELLQNNYVEEHFQINQTKPKTLVKTK